MGTAITDLDLEAANRELAPLSAEDRLRWGVDLFGSDLVMLSSMQKTACVLMHLFFQLGLENEILFGDTGFHFHETLQLRDRIMREYKLNIVTVYPEMTPEQQEKHFGRKLHLFVDGQPECCRLRKELPFLNYVKENGKRMVVSGLRKSEGGRRANLGAVARDPRMGGYTLHPLFDWSDEQVATYLKENQVSVHPLYEQGYASIGCECCTTPIRPGEDERAGRWRHLRAEGDDGPKYCGMNFTDGSGI